MGALEALPGVQRQQHFVVPAANLHLIDRMELNLGVGLGVTTASNGVFLKSIVGWSSRHLWCRFTGVMRLTNADEFKWFFSANGLSQAVAFKYFA